MAVDRRSVLKGLIGTVTAGREAAKLAAEALVQRAGQTNAASVLQTAGLMATSDVGGPAVYKMPGPTSVETVIGEMIDEEYRRLEAGDPDVEDFKSMSPAVKRLMKRMARKRCAETVDVLRAARVLAGGQR